MPQEHSARAQYTFWEKIWYLGVKSPLVVLGHHPVFSDLAN